MLTLSAAFKREAAKSATRPVILVEFVGITNGKFVMADRRLLGYSPSVQAVNSRASTLDPLRCTQSVSASEVVLTPDARWLIRDHKILGKQLKLYLGFDPLDGSPFVEADYAPFSSGIVENFKRTATGIVIEARDPRGVIFTRSGSRITAPSGLDGDEYSDQGAATMVLRDLLNEAGLSTNYHFDAASFTPSSSPSCGHLTIDRLAERGRSLKEPTPVEELLHEISRVLRGYVLVQEDGKLKWKEFNPSGTVVGRFKETDILVDSVEVRQDLSRIVTSVMIRSAFDNPPNTVPDVQDEGESGFRIQFRDDDATAQQDWEFSDSTDNKLALQFDDKWFCSIAETKDLASIPTGTGAIDIRHNDFAGSPTVVETPNVVDATHPGYIAVRGYKHPGLDPAPIEIIKYTSITDLGGGHLRLGGITRGQFGTTEVAHANLIPSGNYGFPSHGPAVIDVTALVRCADMILRRFRQEATVVEFKTPLHTYAFQVGDLVYLNLDIFLRNGQDGLADGNTNVFEVVKKDVDPESWEITWELHEVRDLGRTPAVTPEGGQPGRNRLDDLMGFGTSVLTGMGNILHTFVVGAVPDVSATLVTTIPLQTLFSRAGYVFARAESHTFTALKDTYVDVVPYRSGQTHYRYTEVANGASAPAVGTGEMRAFKVVTDGTAITSVEDLRTFARDDLDTHVRDGATYSRVRGAALSDGKINLAAGAAGLANQLPGAQLADAAVTDSKLSAIAGTNVVGGGGALANLDSTGKLTKAVLVGTGAGATDLQFRSVDGVIRSEATDGTEQAGALRMKEPVIADSTGSEPRRLKNDGGKFKTFSSDGVTEKPTIFSGQFAALKDPTDPMPYAAVLDRGTTNYVKNPSFEVDTTGWEAFASGAGATAPTISRVTTQSFFGDAALFVDSNDADGGPVIGARLTPAGVAALAGEGSRVGQARVMCATEQTVVLNIKCLDSADAEVASAAATATVPANEWVHLWRAVNAPASTAKVVLEVYVNNATAAFDMYVDGAQVEVGSKPSSYCDGTMTGTVWDDPANPHNSSSTRSAGWINHGGLQADKPPAIWWDDGVLDTHLGRWGKGLHIVGAGTTFPTSPATNDVFFRTDRGVLYYYNGTDWVEVRQEPPAWRLSHSGGTNTNIGSAHRIVDFGSTTYNFGDVTVDLANNRIVTGRAGIYHIGVTMEVTGIGSTSQLFVYLNNGSAVSSYASLHLSQNGTARYFSSSIELALGAGADVRVATQADSTADIGWCAFWGHWVRTNSSP